MRKEVEFLPKLTSVVPDGAIAAWILDLPRCQTADRQDPPSLLLRRGTVRVPLDRKSTDGILLHPGVDPTDRSNDSTYRPDLVTNPCLAVRIWVLGTKDSRTNSMDVMSGAWSLPES